MVHFLENLNAFPVQGGRGGIIPRFSREVSQIGERASDSPPVAEFPKNFQAPPVQCSRSSEVTLITGDISLIVG